jgi:hypothetical protein
VGVDIDGHGGSFGWVDRPAWYPQRCDAWATCANNVCRLLFNPRPSRRDDIGGTLADSGGGGGTAAQAREAGRVAMRTPSPCPGCCASTVAAGDGSTNTPRRRWLSTQMLRRGCAYATSTPVWCRPPPSSSRPRTWPAHWACTRMPRFQPGAPARTGARRQRSALTCLCATARAVAARQAPGALSPWLGGRYGSIPDAGLLGHILLASLAIRTSPPRFGGHGQWRRSCWVRMQPSMA